MRLPGTEPDPEIGQHQLRQAFGRPRTYPSVDDALWLLTAIRSLPADRDRSVASARRPGGPSAGS